MKYQFGFCMLDLWAAVAGILLTAGHIGLTVWQKRADTVSHSIDKEEKQTE